LKLELTGKVASGSGEGRKYLELPWVQRQMSEKLGFEPYLGTLNVLLDEESVERKRLLKEHETLKVCSKGFCTGLLFRASVGGVTCGIVIPQVEGYPDEELEIVADVNLRQKLQLRDGDTVIVAVFL
jgi:riboflavin kinase, archaea type